MKYFIYLLAIIILLGVNLGLFSGLKIQGQLPNLLFLLTVCFAMIKQDGEDYLFVAFVAGLFLDFYSTRFFGSFTLALLLLALFLRQLMSNILALALNWKILSLAVVFSWTALNILLWFYALLAAKFNWIGYSADFKTIFSALPAGLFYNLLLLYPVYLLANFLKKLIVDLSFKGRGVIR